MATARSTAKRAPTPPGRPRLLKAAYNYQYVQKDPGAFAHNGKYVIQFLYDNLASLSTKVDVDMTGMIRPDTPAAQ